MSESKPSEQRTNLQVTLPYFHDAEEAFTQTFQLRVQQITRSKGIIAEIKGHIIHEGRESRLIRSSDDQDDVEMHVTEAVLTLKYADISKFTIVDALDAAAKLADQFATGQSKALFKTLDEVTTKTGNVVRAGGPITHDAMFEMLDKMEHEFSGNSATANLVMVIHPDMGPRVAQLAAEFESSRDLKKRHNEIMARKYEQFRTREMDRNLAG